MRFDRIFVLTALAIIAWTPVASSTGFGVNAHIPKDPVSDRIEAAGIEWVRIDFLWSLAEPEEDVYDWTVYDSLVDRLENRGLKISRRSRRHPGLGHDGIVFLRCSR